MNRKLTMFDAGFLNMETPETPMHVASLQLYARPKNAPDDYMESLYRRFVDVTMVGEPFNRKLHSPWPGNLNATWVEDRRLDLEYHIRHEALPRPGRIRELLALVSRLHAQRLDRSRPLWECYLIEGIEGDRFAIYIKIHHALIDGVAGSRLIASRLAATPDECVPPPWSAEWQARQPRRKSRLPLATSPLEALRSFSRGTAQVREMLRLPRDGHAKTIYRAPRSILNSPVTGARRFAAQSWSIARIKTAGKRHGGTINDIFLAMCGGALREYLLSHDALPEQPLVAHVPMSLRTADEADDGGNAVTVVHVSLGTHIADPIERLHVIQESMKAAKDRLSRMKKAEINTYTAITSLPLLIGQSLHTADHTLPVFNVVISNVPGPRETLYCEQAELLASYPVSLIWRGYALNITAQSYRDNLEVGLLACRDSVPRVQRMLDYLESALRELE